MKTNGASKWAVGIFITIFLAVLMYGIGRIDKNSNDIVDIKVLTAEISTHLLNIYKVLDNGDNSPIIKEYQTEVRLNLIEPMDK